jgi:hypothetical protein
MEVAGYAVQVFKDKDAVARAAADIFVNLAPQPHDSGAQCCQTRAADGGGRG